MRKSYLLIPAVFIIVTLSSPAQSHHRIELDDSVAVRVRKITEQEYNSRRVSTVSLPLEQYVVIDEYEEALPYLDGRLKIVHIENSDPQYYGLEVTFNDGNKRILDYGASEIEQYFTRYYPEIDVLIVETDACGDYPLDFNESGNYKYVGDPARHVPSPDGRLRIAGYYPGGAWETCFWFLEKWDEKKGKYGLATNFDGQYQLVMYGYDWFWTGNDTVIFNKEAGYGCHEMQFIFTETDKPDE